MKVISVNAEEARTIGGRIRQIRKVRDKSQAVIAGLAGISTATRDVIVRDMIAELLDRSRRESPMDRELRGMAYRVGLTV